MAEQLLEEESMWSLIIANIVDYMTNDPNMEDVKIFGGTNASIETYPSINLIKDREIEFSDREDRGIVSIFFEAWEQEHDTSDPMIGYKKLSRLEKRMRKSLYAWLNSPARKSILVACKITIKTVIGDNDMWRPALGSRTVVEIQWRKQ